MARPDRVTSYRQGLPPGLLSLVVLVLCFSGALRAANGIEDARLALRTKQFPVAISSLRPLAAAGSADAQYLLGLAQLSGVGTPEDRSAAEKSLRAAAEQSHAAAAYALAGLLATNEIPQVDVARHWIARAAELGYPAAMNLQKSNALPMKVVRPGPEADVALKRAFAFYAARVNDSENFVLIGGAEFAASVDEFGRTPLAVAAQYGSSAVVKLLVENSALVNSVDDYGVSPLMLAAAQPDKATTAELLAAGARLDLVDRAGRSALMYASWADQAEQINLLVRAYAALDLVDERGWTALDVAIQRERTLAAERLRAAGAVAKLGPAPQARSAGGMDPTRTGALYQGWAPLLVAVSRDDVDSLKRLRAAGADLDAVTPSGDSAVHVAIESDAAGALRELLAGGADGFRKNKRGDTPLMVAARRDDLDAVNALLATRADGTSVQAALLEAAQREPGRILPVLLAAGVDANAADADKVPTLILAARAGNEAGVAALLGAGAKVDARDTRGRSALWYAAASGHAEMIGILVRARANVSIADDEDTTPLIAAAARGHAVVVERLLAAGAKTSNVTKSGDSGLLGAAAAGHAKVVAVLLRDRSTLDKSNEFGDTPLIAASRNGHVDVCALLLRAGANTRLRNKDRSSASDVAEWRGFAAIAKLVGGR
ncbi:MAG: ankyrin repeat domain-containing protein [Steroidobacteraceae bacterium]